MKKVYVRRRDRYTGRTHNKNPNYTGPNRAKRRERTTFAHAGVSGAFTGMLYVITRSLRSLIPPKKFCPPGRHFGKHTQPIAK